MHTLVKRALPPICVAVCFTLIMTLVIHVRAFCRGWELERLPARKLWGAAARGSGDAGTGCGGAAAAGHLQEIYAVALTSPYG